MKDKKEMVDFPEYEPEGRISFPPGPDEKPVKDKARPEEKRGKPYTETYDPDPKSADPSQTMPGAPDIRDPGTKLPPDEELHKLSPDVDLKGKYDPSASTD